MKTTILMTIEHSKPIPDLTDIAANRVWPLDGVTGVTAAIQDDASIAKMDVSASPIPPLSGRYRLTTMADDGIAKMDAWIVEITVLSSSCDDSAHDCKERT